jgi:hypothetical protein
MQATKLYVTCYSLIALCRSRFCGRRHALLTNYQFLSPGFLCTTHVRAVGRFPTYAWQAFTSFCYRTRFSINFRTARHNTCPCKVGAHRTSLDSRTVVMYESKCLQLVWIQHGISWTRMENLSADSWEEFSLWGLILCGSEIKSLPLGYFKKSEIYKILQKVKVSERHL